MLPLSESSETQTGDLPSNLGDGGSGTHRQAPEQPTDSHDGGSRMPRQAPEQPTDPGNRGSAAAQRERKRRPPNPCTTATISTKTRKATGSMPKAKLSDCKKNMRMVGFRQEQRSQLEKYCSDTKPVALLNCEVKQARQSEELEVVMKLVQG